MKRFSNRPMLATISILVLMVSPNCVRHDHAKEGAAKVPYVVETSVVKPTKFALERRYIGTMKTEKFSVLSVKASGTVEKIYVSSGAKVKKGDLLISLKSGVEKAGFELAQKSLISLEKELLRHQKLFRTNDITRSELERLERDVLQARSKLEEQRRSLENVEIRAPFDGVVGVPRVVLGESVLAGAPIITISDGPFIAFINIPASRLLEVKVGQPVSLKNMNSTISAVEKSIDEKTRVGFATAVFPTCQSCIIGDSVYAKITVNDKDQALLVSRNAIFYKDQKPHLVLVKKGEDKKMTASIKEVTLGEEQDGLVEVISGISTGDEIISANPKRIPDGAEVTVHR